MNIVADESVDGPIVHRLRADGHDVLYVAEMAPGIADDEVLRHAAERNALLLTTDKDFGELVFRRRTQCPSVVLLRLTGLSNEMKAEVCAEVLRDHRERLVEAFAVVTSTQVRIRRRL